MCQVRCLPPIIRTAAPYLSQAMTSKLQQHACCMWTRRPCWQLCSVTRQSCRLLQVSATVEAAFLTALRNNVDSLAKQFPLAAFELGADERPPLLGVTCPTAQKAAIVSQVQTDIQALTVASCTLSLKRQAGAAQDTSGVPPKAMQQLQQQLQGQALDVEFKASAMEVVITAFANVLPSVEQTARTCLGLVTQPSVPQAAPLQSVSREQQVVGMLQVSRNVSSIPECDLSAGVGREVC